MYSFNTLPVPRPLFASSMSTSLFLDPYQVCECECGLFLDFSALFFCECNHGVWKQTLLTAKWCSLQQQHTWMFMACIALPLTTLSPLKVLLKLLSLGYCSGIKNWQDTDTLWLTPLGRKRVRGPQAGAGTGHLLPSTCHGSVPVIWGCQGNGVANTALLFLLKSLSSLSHYLKWGFSAIRF